MARDFEDHCWKDVIGPEVLAIYEPYRRKLRLPSRPALLAIDLYNLVYRGGAKPPHELLEHPNTCGIYAWNAIEPTKRLFAAARAAGLPVIYLTSSVRPKRVQSTKRRPIAESIPDAYEIFEAFAPEPDDMVIRKERASGFAGTPLLATLNELDVNGLVVCGESTSGCVRATVVDAYSSGYHVTVVEECVYDRAEITHKVNLFDMHHKYADVMVLDEVIAKLSGSAVKAAAE
jgi:nicotinamidase-related amidase